MDRNTIIGFVLIAILVIGWSIFNMPTKEQYARQKRMQDSIAVVNKLKEKATEANGIPGADRMTDSSIIANDTIKANNRASVTSSAKGLFKDSTANAEQFVTLENEVMKVTLSSKGGRVYNVELKKYTTWDKKPLLLFDGPNNSFGYFFYSGTTEVNTGDLFFKPVNSSASIAGKDSASIHLRAYLTPTRYLEETYSIKGGSYLIDYHFSMIGVDSIIQNNLQYLSLVWNATLNNVEKNVDNNRTYSSLYYKYKNEDATSLSLRNNDEKKLATPLDWISFKQHFFNATIISSSAFEEANVKIKTETDPSLVKSMTAEVVLPYKRQPNVNYAMQLYFGPNKYQDLKKLDNGMEGIVPLGWGIFAWVSGPINKWCIIPMFDFFSRFIASYGIIILLMTLVIKLCLMPFTYRSLLSAAKMKVIKPEIDELKEKYKDDQAKFGQEQLKLFQKAGVSPLGGCLPLLLQFPFLVAMYSFFPISIELRQKAFLWATDLSSYDSIYNFPSGFTIPFYGNHVSLFTLLMTVTSILTAVYNNQLNSVTGQAKWMQYLMPIMLLGLFNNFPAALTYYYFLSNVITFALQWVVQNYFLDHAAIHKQIQERKKQPVKKKSGFLARLEEMQREQAKKRG